MPLKNDLVIFRCHLFPGMAKAHQHGVDDALVPALLEWDAREVLSVVRSDKHLGAHLNVGTGPEFSPFAGACEDGTQHRPPWFDDMPPEEGEKLRRVMFFRKHCPDHRHPEWPGDPSAKVTQVRDQIRSRLAGRGHSAPVAGVCERLRRHLGLSAGESEVDARFGDPGRRGDAVNGHPSVAVLDHQAERRPQDAVVNGGRPGAAALGARPYGLDNLFTIPYSNSPHRSYSTTEGSAAVKIITYDRMKPGVTYEKIEPYLPQEVANVWRLWKAGIVRENYARADELGVVIVFEVDSVETARRYTDDFPLTKAGLIEWFFIPLQVPLPLEVLFDPKVDAQEPYDRTLSAARRR